MLHKILLSLGRVVVALAQLLESAANGPLGGELLSNCTLG